MDNYRKVKVIGRGAHGTVSLYLRVSDGKHVVIKEIPVELKTSNERQVALGEAKTLQMFSFPFIIGYYEYFFDDNNLCIVMEYAEGGTLAEFLADRNGHHMDDDQILHLFAQIVLSLQHLHSRQVLHRDLKTQNILLNRTRTVCKLSDFGISKILSNTKSKATTVLGTPSYMSPEICEGQPYNQKSDIWSLGCVLYELATLKRAFDAETMGALVMKIMRGDIGKIPDTCSEGLRLLILKLMERDPGKRPTVAEIMALPIMIGPILKVISNMGAIPCARPRLLKTSVNQKLRSSLGSKKKHAVNQPQQQNEAAIAAAKALVK